jgi:hypothetical protein
VRVAHQAQTVTVQLPELLLCQPFKFVRVYQ